jgi:hypothetical protein
MWAKPAHLKSMEAIAKAMWAELQKLIKEYGPVETHMEGWPLKADGSHMIVRGQKVFKPEEMPLDALGILLEKAKTLPQESLNKELLEEFSKPSVDKERVEALLKKGAQASMRVKRGSMETAKSGLLLTDGLPNKILELLLKNGANPDDEWEYDMCSSTVGNRLLVSALENGEEEFERILQVPIKWEEHLKMGGWEGRDKVELLIDSLRGAGRKNLAAVAKEVNKIGQTKLEKQLEEEKKRKLAAMERLSPKRTSGPEI